MLFFGRVPVFVCLAFRHFRFDSNTNSTDLDAVTSKMNGQNLTSFKDGSSMKIAAANSTTANFSSQSESPTVVGRLNETLRTAKGTPAGALPPAPAQEDGPLDPMLNASQGFDVTLNASQGYGLGRPEKMAVEILEDKAGLTDPTGRIWVITPKRNPSAPPAGTPGVMPLSAANDSTSAKVGHDVVIVGTARDIAAHIGRITKELKDVCEEVAGSTSRCTLLFFENDSRDGSRKLLENSGAKLVDEVHLNLTSRTARLAHARKSLLHKVKEVGYTPEFVMISDLDNCASAAPASAVTRAISSSQAWDVVSFDRGDYYDSWALRCEGADENTNMPRLKPYAKCLAGLRGGEGPKVVSGGDTYVPVHSAFNSFAIYKYSVVRGCEDSYTGDRNAGGHGCAGPGECTEECEHVPFHACLRDRQGARVMVADWKLNTPGGGCGSQLGCYPSCGRGQPCRQGAGNFGLGKCA